MRQQLIWLFTTLLTIGLMVVIIWLLLQITIQRTSGVEFCTTCHSMQPIEASYRADVHGRPGREAYCTDCHVTHDSFAAHVMGKAQAGAHDIWAELTYDLDNIDWQAKRAHRERYVYDSGCMLCHTEIAYNSRGNPKALIAHRPYFLQETKKQCVSCHPHVGHKNLSSTFIQ